MVKKEVFYIRHAKSSWDHPNLSDIERPLNERGHLTAEKMAVFLKKQFDLKDFELISSPARRAYSTSKYFAEEFGKSKSDIRIDESLYYGGELDYLKCLHSLPETVKAAFIFGHNPTIETFVSKIENGYSGLVPTCTVFYTISNMDSWQMNAFTDLKLKNYYFPKIVLAK